VRTRLAQKVKGCHNIAFYDCNPTGRGHWAYKEFIRGLNPDTDEEYTDQVKSRYTYCNMTPYDNAENLPDGFIENQLESLPELKRKRFLLGEWTDPEGVIFQNWSLVDQIPEQIKARALKSIGVDFGFTVDPATAIYCYLHGDELYLDELVYETGLTNGQLAARIKQFNVGSVDVFCDSAEPKSKQDLINHGLNAKASIKGQDSIRAGIDFLLSKKIYITKGSVNLINEAENYCWRKDANERALPEPIDDWNHAWDAVRYGVFKGNRAPARVSNASRSLGL